MKSYCSSSQPAVFTRALLHAAMLLARDHSASGFLVSCFHYYYYLIVLHYLLSSFTSLLLDSDSSILPHFLFSHFHPTFLLYHQLISDLCPHNMPLLPFNVYFSFHPSRPLSPSADLYRQQRSMDQTSRGAVLDLQPRHHPYSWSRFNSVCLCVFSGVIRHCQPAHFCVVPLN